MIKVLAAAIVSVFAGAAAFAQAPIDRAIDMAGEQAKAEALILDRIAQERARHAPDARPLKADSALTQIARARSADMADGAPFAHEDEAGRFAAADRVQARFGPYGTIGENIAMERAVADSFEAVSFARRAVQNWMNSQGHRAAILSPAYDRSGVGVVFKDGFAYATQVFWGPPPTRSLRSKRRWPLEP